MEKHEAQSQTKDILMAVDDSDNSRRAVAYTARLLGGVDGIRVTLLHVIPLPEEDFFPDDQQREDWLRHYRHRMEGVLAAYRGELVSAGFRPEAVAVRMPLRNCPSMAECILNERSQGHYGTIVLGRQGLSRKEEFLFGSISSKIVSHARQCTVWVVA